MQQEDVKEEYNWRVLTIILSASIVTGIYRDGFAALFPLLQVEFGLTRAQLGLQFSFLFFVSMLASVFSGRAVDIWGGKKGMVIGLIFLGLLVIMHGIAPSYIYLLIIAAITGLGMSIIAPATNKGVMEWFPARMRATAMGVNSAGFPIGGAVAASLLPAVGIVLGWRLAIGVAGMIVLLAATFIFLFYRDRNIVKVKNSKGSTVKGGGVLAGIPQLLANRTMFFMGLLGFVLGLTSGAIAAHFTLFLYLDYGFSMAIAGLGFSIVQIGGGIGRPVWGLISDQFLNGNREKGILLIGILFVGLTLVFFFTKHMHIIILLVLALLIGLTGRGWHGLYYAAMAERIGGDNTGTAIGFASIFIRLGLTVGAPVFGFLADLTGSYGLSWLLLGQIVFLLSLIVYYYTKRVSETEPGLSV
ncbi:MAG: MFS transporter [bacterium]